MDYRAVTQSGRVITGEWRRRSIALLSRALPELQDAGTISFQRCLDVIGKFLERTAVFFSLRSYFLVIETFKAMKDQS